jgi:hypothetical protein
MTPAEYHAWQQMAILVYSITAIVAVIVLSFASDRSSRRSSRRSFRRSFQRYGRNSAYRGKSNRSLPFRGI